MKFKFKGHNRPIYRHLNPTNLNTMTHSLSKLEQVLPLNSKENDTIYKSSKENQNPMELSFKSKVTTPLLDSKDLNHKTEFKSPKTLNNFAREL